MCVCVCIYVWICVCMCIYIYVCVCVCNTPNININNISQRGIDPTVINISIKIYNKSFLYIAENLVMPPPNLVQVPLPPNLEAAQLRRLP